MIKTSYCNGCGKTKSEVKTLLQVNDSTQFCNECIELFAHTIKEIEDDSATEFSPVTYMKPSEIKDKLDLHVVDQERAKRLISVAASRHLARINNPVIDGVEIEKSNVLMVGPTGSGKTLIAKKLAEILDIPMVQANSTELTAAGYVGSDVENMINILVDRANGDIEVAQRGIIFIDEIDKLSRKSENPSLQRDVSGEDVQQGLLKLIEGCEVDVAPTSVDKRKHPKAKTFKFNTQHVLFICAGSFAGIEQQIRTRQKESQGIGFNSPVVTNSEDNTFDYSLITNEDLVKYGMISELLGRLPRFVPLQELSKPYLKCALTEPQNSLVKQFKAQLKASGTELIFPDKTIDKIVDEAYELRTGARGLRAVMENLLEDIQFYGPDLEVKQFFVGETKLEDFMPNS